MDKLLSLEHAGVDVPYVLTGEHSGASSALAPDEAALLDNYRNSPEGVRKVIRAASAAGPQSEITDEAA